MHQYTSAALKQELEESRSNPFQLRVAICGTTNHDPIRQVGMSLLFASLLGSLARMWLLTLKTRTNDLQPTP